MDKKPKKPKPGKAQIRDLKAKAAGKVMGGGAKGGVDRTWDLEKNEK